MLIISGIRGHRPAGEDRDVVTVQALALLDRPQRGTAARRARDAEFREAFVQVLLGREHDPILGACGRSCHRDQTAKISS